MEYVKIKKEPGVENDDDPEIVMLRKCNNLISLRNSKTNIIPRRVNELDERSISSAVGRFHQKEMLRKTFGNNSNNQNFFGLSDSEDGSLNQNHFDEFSQSGKNEGEDTYELSKSEETIKKNGVLSISKNNTVNMDVKLAQRRREQKMTKEKRSDKKRRRRNPIPSDTWLSKVSDTLLEPTKLEEEDMIRKPVNKLQAGFIGGSKQGEVYFDADGIIHTKTPPPIEEQKKFTSYSFENPTAMDIDPQEEDLSLIMQEYYMKKPERAVNSDGNSILERASGKVMYQDDTTVLTALDEPDPKKKKKIFDRGISVPETHDLHQKLSRILIGERTMEECRLLTEAHLQQMTTVNEEFTMIIDMLMRDRQYNIPIHSLGPIDKYLATLIRHTRAMEEPYLRQVLPGERPCVEGDECEGRNVPGCTVKVTCPEFQTMEEVMYFQKNGKWRGDPKHCLMCLRSLATFAHFYVKSQCLAYNSSMLRMSDCISEKMMEPLIIAPFSNIVGQGEYSPWDVILSLSNRFTGLFEPVVFHVRRRYIQVKRNGIYYFEQTYEKPDRNLECRDTWDCDESWLNEISNLQQEASPYHPQM